MIAAVEINTNVEATCKAWATLLPSGLTLPLHWAGKPSTAEESVAEPTTIAPGVPARLEIAVALPWAGNRPGGPIPGAISSGDVPMFVAGLFTPPWKGEGCWVAQPAAIYNPDPRLPAYLPPGEHRVRVRVIPDGGEEVTAVYRVTSPSSWEGLRMAQITEPQPL